ncbi:hypothetical protein P153DRAFT_360638 [Dothidotthia symphoricarpi CBS 119687]|uniref:Uncharacterized protein n=1 Tax=Dothidotthia symphoricarpi CBS 119687 TaxID=1392245 RepID=A0A6A6A2P8_9PLEO|nr:uncharacterized protein P153DRAFT_360638 [Dothidotthia symphoricarpi CBS 119687]KAF2125008.1 hypothetical protein P153DRAFT_360638 [Dothidotthia symphoricarpi CBS 119687]
MARLPASTNDSAIDDNLVFISSDLEAEERGRLKRRRKSSHSPRRASSPSRGHDRTSGSRYRLHHRKHHRPSSPSSSVSPPTIAQKKHRRRSDAELDHTFRGRVRNRGATLEEGVDEDEAEGREDIRERKRSAPPSRNREEGVDGEGMRRQRSYPNLYKEERRDSKITDEESLAPTDSVIVDGVVPVVQGA